MMDLFKAIGLGLVVLLPLANPLTTVALFLGLAGNMNSAERNRQSYMASVYVFAIMMVAYYAGQLVMNTFGISIPGLRIAGGLIVAFIGFRMLFPQQKAHCRLPETCSRQTNVLMRLFFQRHWPFAEYEHSPYQRGTGGYGANIADGRH